MTARAGRSNDWRPVRPPTRAVAVHAFQLDAPRTDLQYSENGASDANHSLSFDVGDVVICIEELVSSNQPAADWLRGYVDTQALSSPVAGDAEAPITSTADFERLVSAQATSGRIGIFPRSFVTLTARDIGSPDTPCEFATELATNVTSDLQRQKSSQNAGSRHRRPGAGLRPIGMEPLTEVDEADSPRSNSDPTDIVSTSGQQTMAGSTMERSGPAAAPSKDHFVFAQPLNTLEDEALAVMKEWLQRTHLAFHSRQYDVADKLREAALAAHACVIRMTSSGVRDDERLRARRQLAHLLAETESARGSSSITRESSDGQILGYDSQLHSSNWTTVPRLYLRQALARAHPRAGVSDSASERTTPLRKFASMITSSSVPDQNFKVGYQLALEVKNFVPGDTTRSDNVQLLFSLYNKAQGQFISEEYGVDWRDGAMAGDDVQCRRAVFVDLGQHDVFDQVFLVCRVVKIDHAKLDDVQSRSGVTSDPNSTNVAAPPRREDSSKRETSHRVPLGCAVLDISSLQVQNGSDDQEDDVLDLTVQESLNQLQFSTLHEELINHRIKHLANATGRAVLDLKLRLSTVDEESSSRRVDAGIKVRRLDGPDGIAIDNDRNELFIKLWSGQLSSLNAGRGFGSAARPARVTVSIRDEHGDTSVPALRYTVNHSLSTELTSLTFKSSSPAWGELYKLQLSQQDLRRCHLFFTVQVIEGAEGDRPAAFAFLPLFREDGLFQADGPHELVLYRYDDSVDHSALYLDCSSTVASQEFEKQKLDAMYTSTHASITIRTLLHSNVETQDPRMAALLRWDNQPAMEQAQARAIVSDAVLCDKGEICKFLSQTLDALFRLHANAVNDNGELDDIIFEAIVSVLGTTSDRRYRRFDSQLRHYIQSLTGFPAVGSLILRSTTKLLSDSSKATSPELRSSIKVWSSLFELVGRAGQIADDKSSLARDLDTALDAICSMMSTQTPPQIVGTHALALQHWPTTLSVLGRLLTGAKLSDHVIAFLDHDRMTRELSSLRLLAVGQVVAGPAFVDTASRAALAPTLVRWLKPTLAPFDEHIQCSSKDSQQVKDATRIKWIENQRLAISIAAHALDHIQLSLADVTITSNRSLHGQEQDNIEYMLNLLPRVCEYAMELRRAETTAAIEKRQVNAAGRSGATFLPMSAPFLSRSAIWESDPEQHNNLIDAGVADAACVILATLQTASVKVLTNWLDTMLEVEGRDNLARLLSTIFRTLRSMLAPEAFPSVWFNLLVLVHNVTLKFSNVSADFLERDFIPSQHQVQPYAFKTTLWRDFFDMLLQLANSRVLDTARLSVSERRALDSLLGQARGEVAFRIKRMWNALGWPSGQAGIDQHRIGGFQVQFVPHLVGGALSLCLKNHTETRQAGVSMLGSMFISEYHLNADIRSVEVEVFNRLDELLLQQNAVFEDARPTFLVELRTTLDRMQLEQPLRTLVDCFVDSLESFLDLLMTVRSLPPGDEWQDDRTAATLALLRYLEKTGKPDSLIRYLHKLAAHESEQENYTQAGLVHHLHAQMYDWRLDQLLKPDAELDLPAQTAFQRKQQLYLRAINLLVRGGGWEIADRLCKELQHQIETATFDHITLKQVVDTQVELFSRMVDEARPAESFFRVAFYGNLFPATVAGKQFVYKAKATSLSGFVKTMLSKHPRATLLRTSAVPGDDVQYADGQFLQITEVMPVVEDRQDVLSNALAPENVRRYYETNETNRFTFSRQFTRGADELRVHGDDAIGRLWHEDTTLLCESAFPSIATRLEVVELRIVEVSPVEHAIQQLRAQERHLRTLEHRMRIRGNLAQNRAELDPSELAIALNEAIDPPSSRGHLAYRGAFLRPQFLASFPDQQKAVERLRRALQDLAACIAQCLNLLAALSTSDVRGFHRELQRLFESNFHAELDHIPELFDFSSHFINFDAFEGRASLSDVGDARDDSSSLRPGSPTSLRRRSKSAGESKAEGMRGSAAAGPRVSGTARRPSSAASVFSNGAAGKSTFSRRSSLLGSLRAEGGRRGSGLLDMLKRRSSATEERVAD
ncbi:hypothetical protein ACM66B_004593 [Microbotryomycetes sp. NB124-2]